MKKSNILKTAICMSMVVYGLELSAQQPAPNTTADSARPPRPNPADTEVWGPTPAAVTPGKTLSEAPSDAIVLFGGTNLDEWVTVKDKSPAKWTVGDGVFTVNKKTGGGNIETKRSFKSYQLHIEWMVPASIQGTGQGRGNSGVFLASTGGGDGGYELQILDSYNNENKTYVNGMAASIYKQFAPASNPAKKAGEWNVYDISWKAPVFNEDRSVKTPAKVTVLFNGVLVHNNVELLGETVYIGKPSYKPYESAPIKLQSHGDPSEPISFRNIWVREIN